MIFMPAGPEQFTLDAGFRAGFALQDVVGNMAQGGMFWRAWTSRTRLWSSR